MRILLIGGGKSGKSTLAQQLAGVEVEKEADRDGKEA